MSSFLGSALYLSLFFETFDLDLSLLDGREALLMLAFLFVLHLFGAFIEEIYYAGYSA